MRSTALFLKATGGIRLNPKRISWKTNNQTAPEQLHFAVEASIQQDSFRRNAMLKIKFFAVVLVLSLAAIVSNLSPIFVSKAESDVIMQQIAGYKTWQRINKEPIKVAESIIVEGTEVVRTGDVGG